MSNNLYLELKNSNRRTEQEESERIVNLFMKKWKELDLTKELKKNQFYEKPSTAKHKAKRRLDHLKTINEKVILGTIKPRNKRLHEQILNDYKDGKISIRNSKK